MRNLNRWLKGLLAFAVTLSLLYMGQLVWGSYAVAQPLDKAIRGIDGVEAITWANGHQRNEPVKIYVTFNNSVNLPKTYNEISERAAQILGRQPFKIIIQDHRTPELEQLYYDAHYYLQEAISTGNFSAMADKVQEKAQSKNVTSRIFVDNRNIYLQFIKGNDTLFMLVPRSTGEGGKNNGLY